LYIRFRNSGCTEFYVFSHTGMCFRDSGCQEHQNRAKSPISCNFFCNTGRAEITHAIAGFSCKTRIDFRCKKIGEISHRKQGNKPVRPFYAPKKCTNINFDSQCSDLTSSVPKTHETLTSSIPKTEKSVIFLTSRIPILLFLYFSFCNQIDAESESKSRMLCCTCPWKNLYVPVNRNASVVMLSCRIKNRNEDG